jgi:hypothetical protein
VSLEQDSLCDELKALLERGTADGGCNHTLLLEMFEPVVGGAGGSAEWIRWFDGLQESIALIAEEELAAAMRQQS